MAERPHPLRLRHRFPRSQEEGRALWERQRDNPNLIQFEVTRLGDFALLGLVELASDPHRFTAQMIAALGPEARGATYSYEAGLLVCDWAFHVVARRSLWVQILEPNTGVF